MTSQLGLGRQKVDLPYISTAIIHDVTDWVLLQTVHYVTDVADAFLDDMHLRSNFKKMLTECIGPSTSPTTDTCILVTFSLNLEDLHLDILRNTALL